MNASCPNAAATSPRVSASTARVVPHPGQSRPVIEWTGHGGTYLVMPGATAAVATTTAAAPSVVSAPGRGVVGSATVVIIGSHHRIPSAVSAPAGRRRAIDLRADWRAMEAIRAAIGSAGGAIPFVGVPTPRGLWPERVLHAARRGTSRTTPRRLHHVVRGRSTVRGRARPVPRRRVARARRAITVRRRRCRRRPRNPRPDDRGRRAGVRPGDAVRRSRDLARPTRTATRRGSSPAPICPPDRSTGCILANELLDNIPFRLCVFDGTWRESFVADAGGRHVGRSPVGAARSGPGRALPGAARTERERRSWTARWRGSSMLARACRRDAWRSSTTSLPDDGVDGVAAVAGVAPDVSGPRARPALPRRAGGAGHHDRDPARPVPRTGLAAHPVPIPAAVGHRRPGDRGAAALGGARRRRRTSRRSGCGVVRSRRARCSTLRVSVEFSVVDGPLATCHCDAATRCALAERAGRTASGTVVGW